MKQKSSFYILLITLVGIVLRVYHLGATGLWRDEIGVANVMNAENIFIILRTAKSHVMAMPLDYFVVYLFSKIGTSEAILRLPAMLWGSFSIPVLYFLVNEISKNKNYAYFASLLLAISPAHIQYSQEVRFYASLVFFFLLGTLFGYKALKNSSTKSWTIYLVIVVIGFFFHIYVLFVVFLVSIWMFLFWKKKKINSNQIGVFLITNVSIVIYCLVGAYVLTSNLHPGTIYNDYFYQILMAVAKGLGFLPMIGSNDNVLMMVSCVILLVFFLIGLWQCIAGNDGVWCQGVGIFVPIMIFVIIFLDLIKAYFIHPRQLLFLLPFTLFIVVVGAIWVWNAIYKNSQRGSINIRLVFIGTVCLILSQTYFVGLNSYYHWTKDYNREIVQQIDCDELSKHTLYMAPSYNVLSFLYYYQLQYHEEYNGHIVGFDTEEIQYINFQPGDMIFIEPNLAKIPEEWLLNNEFVSIPILHPLQNRDDILWLLPEIE